MTLVAQSQRRTHGSHREGNDPARDRAGLHRNSADFAEIVAALDQISRSIVRSKERRRERDDLHSP